MIVRFRKSEDGSTAVIVALLLTVLLGFAAIGVDVASLYRERAQLQSVSDLTALSAMANTNDASARASQTLSRNNQTDAALTTLETGRFLRNPALAPEDRFQVLPHDAAGINAVRVVLNDDAPLHFALIFTDDTTVALERTSISTRTGGASFSLDSHIVNLKEADLNTLLAQEFGVNATLSTNDIALLGSAEINIATLLGALNVPASRNPADVLNATTTVADFIVAAQSVLPLDIGNRLNGLASTTTAISVSSLIGGIDTDLGITATDFLGEIDISALDLVTALIVAQTNDDGLTIAAPTNVAGVISANISLTAGAPPAQSGWIALGEEGVKLHRAAVRLNTDIAVLPDLLGRLDTGLEIASVNLPIYTEIAGSSATLEQISCNATAKEAVAARFSTNSTALHPNNGTSVAALYLGELANTTGPIDPATLGFADVLEVNIVIPLLLLPDIEISGLTIQARSHVAVGASQIETLSFTDGEVDVANETGIPTSKTFGSGELLGSAITDLLSPENTEFRIKPGQEGLVSGVAAPLLDTLLNTLPQRLLSGVAAPVDSVLDATLASAGIALGAGELTLLEHHCEPLRLVQ